MAPVRDIRVKICGLTTPETVRAAIEAGADYVGFVLYPPSPRALSLDDIRALAPHVADSAIRVALTVDADDDLIAQISELPIDMIQLQGKETPARAAEVRGASGLPVMKAVGIRDASDLARIDAYEDIVDQMLIDAKPREGATLPGGNGLSFDWQLLSGRTWRGPWMLAGGLTSENLAEAIERTGAQQLDVSSGVETRPGEKDPAKIAAFLAAAGK